MESRGLGGVGDWGEKAKGIGHFPPSQRHTTTVFCFPIPYFFWGGFFGVIFRKIVEIPEMCTKKGTYSSFNYSSSMHLIFTSCIGAYTVLSGPARS